MSRKSWPHLHTVCPGSSYSNLHNELLYKMGYYFLDTWYNNTALIKQISFSRDKYLKFRFKTKIWCKYPVPPSQSPNTIHDYFTPVLLGLNRNTCWETIARASTKEWQHTSSIINRHRSNNLLRIETRVVAVFLITFKVFNIFFLNLG